MRTELKLFRIKQHLNQTEMAEKCGTTRNTYSLIENGKRGGNADFWLNLQKAFDVPIEKVQEFRKVDKKEVK